MKCDFELKDIIEINYGYAHSIVVLVNNLKVNKYCGEGIFTLCACIQDNICDELLKFKPESQKLVDLTDSLSGLVVVFEKSESSLIDNILNSMALIADIILEKCQEIMTCWEASNK